MSSTSYRISESQIEVPNFLIKNQNRSKTIAKAYFFFWSLRGRGKLIRDDFFSKTRAFPYFIFFSEPQNEAPTCVVQDFRKKSSENRASVGRGSIFAGSKSYQKRGRFSKWRLQNDDVHETFSIFEAKKLAASSLGLAWLGLAWLGSACGFQF